jgi:hypothetical protein
MLTAGHLDGESMWCEPTQELTIGPKRPTEEKELRPMTELLKTELKTYEENFTALVAAHEGKFVLVHGDRVIGAFDSQLDAITAGYRQLGNVPFLVKQVLRVETPMSFVSNLLGV